MNSDKLYKVQEQDLDRLKEILTVCFQNDPLYSTLIEDEATKERLLPHLLECDVTELFETCEVFADSPELKGVLILSDESDHRHAFYNYFVSLKESLITDGWLLHEDPTIEDIFNLSRKITSTPLGPPSFMKPETSCHLPRPLIRNFNITVSQNDDE